MYSHAQRFYLKTLEIHTGHRFSLFTGNAENSNNKLSPVLVTGRTFDRNSGWL